MKTINQIGNSALERLFCRRDSENYTCAFQISRTECDLRVRPENSTKSHKWTVKFCSGATYYAWGMELGLRELQNARGTLFDQIAALPLLPSHIVKKLWSSDNYAGDREVITVYRLTKKQESDLRALRIK